MGANPRRFYARAALKKIGVFAVLPAVLSGSLACIATQQDVLDLESQTDSLKSDISDLKKTLASLQGDQADLADQVKNLHDDLGVYTETIKENEGQMSALSSKIDDMRAQIAGQVLSIGKALTAQQIQNLEAQKAAFEKEAKARANSPTELFNAADIRLGLKEYDLAARGFEGYLEKFPDGAFADAALYKLARCRYGLGQWRKAGEKFALFLSRYPKNNLTASARLMYARCLVKLGGKQKEARQYLESVRADFPASPEAHAAALELGRLERPAQKRRRSPKRPGAASQ